MLPGMLFVYDMLPFWDAQRTRPAAQAAMHGTNAAVVGILGAALYNPAWTSAVLMPRDFALALTGFLLLTVWKMPPLNVVAAAAGTRQLSHRRCDAAFCSLVAAGKIPGGGVRIKKRSNSRSA
jgi:chromate transporter